MTKKLEVCNEFVEFARSLSINELKDPSSRLALIEYNHITIYRRVAPDKEIVKELFNQVLKEKETAPQQSQEPSSISSNPVV